jgi:hypothetical protein
MGKMRVRRQDSDGDMVWGGGPSDYYRNVPDGVAQVVGTRLGLWVGEWFLDTTEGTPWYGGVLGVGTRRSVEPVIRARIAKTLGVKSIDAFSLSVDPDARTAHVEATITTEYGTTTVAGNL